ncbi:HipA family kinase [Alteromonas sp. a30]|uniref:HipA family kinase n=1 Tax=Alteromonas sp. a30 TaxID=2730917 RepID=UPI00227F3B69|nr:HipA family kinase [Alteromonas sp. a30]
MGKKYVVKRLNAGFKGCVYEWVAGNLGRLFGLNIPDVELVNIDDELVEYDADLQIELGAGIAFASKYHSSLNEVNYHELTIANKSALQDLFVFDYWIKNDDRNLTENGGNPNLFQDITTKKLVVFDHNLAFDTDFDLTTFKNTHVSSFLMKGQQDLFEQTLDITSYQSRLNTVYAEFDNVVASLPREWLDEIPDAAGELARLRLVLEEFNHDQFWEALV